MSLLRTGKIIQYLSSSYNDDIRQCLFVDKRFIL